MPFFVVDHGKSQFNKTRLKSLCWRTKRYTDRPAQLLIYT